MIKVLPDRIVLQYRNNIALCLFENKQFVTWWTPNLKDFYYGHYFADDLEAALKDFNQRTDKEEIIEAEQSV